MVTFLSSPSHRTVPPRLSETNLMGTKVLPDIINGEVSMVVFSPSFHISLSPIFNLNASSLSMSITISVLEISIFNGLRTALM